MIGLYVEATKDSVSVKPDRVDAAQLQAYAQDATHHGRESITLVTQKSHA